MFDLGWSKILILAVVAIVVVGPKELPVLLRTLGQFIAQLRRHAADFRAQFDEAMRSTELDQIRKDVEAIKTDAQASIRGIGQSLEQEVNASKASIEESFEAVDAQFNANPTNPPVIAPPDAAVSSPPASPATAEDTATRSPMTAQTDLTPDLVPLVVPSMETAPSPATVKSGA